MPEDKPVFVNAAPVIVPESVQEARYENAARRWAYPLLGMLFVPLFVLALKDRRAWSWDEAFYAEYSVGLFRTLLHSPSEWPSAMLRALGDRAPAIAWVGQLFVPVGYLFPFVQTGLLCFVLVTQMATVLLLYKVLSKAFRVALPTLVACGIVASGSLFTAMTSRYFVEPLQTFSVAWVAALAVYHERFTRTTLALHVLSAVAFGLLVKISSPIFQVPFLVYLAYVFIAKTSNEDDQHRAIHKGWTGLTVAASLAFVLVGATASWYAVNYRATVQHLIDAGSGSLSVYYGHKGPLLAKFTWWSRQFQRSFLWFPVLILIALVIPRAGLLRWRTRRPVGQSDVLSMLSVGWIAGFLFLLARNINEDTRYLLALLPCVAFGLCWVTSNLKSRKLVVAIGLAATVQFVAATALIYGKMPPLEGFSNLLQPYVKDDLALRDSLLCAANTADGSSERPTIVGEELPEFNSVGIAFYSVTLGRKLERSWSYSGLDFTQTDPEKEWRRVQNSGCRYYAFRKFASAYDPDPLNHLARLMLQKVASDPEFSFRADKSNERVLLFERAGGGLRYDPNASGGIAKPTKKEIGFQGVDPLAKLPFGLLEYPPIGTVLQGKESLPIVGWAVFPAGVKYVEIQVDGRHATDAANASRPDVEKAYPKFKSTGYAANLNLGTLSEGEHRISAIAHSLDGSSRILSDAPIVTRTGFQGVDPQGKLPFGLLEYPTPNAVVPGDGSMNLVGWSVSPSGVLRVEILLDGNHLGDAEISSRPDVLKAYPGLPSTGFIAKLKRGSIPAGKHQIAIVCYGRNGSSRIIARTLVTRGE